MRPAIAIAGAVVLLLAGCAGLPGSAAPGTTGTGDGTTPDDPLGVELRQSGSTGPACEYTSLYDRTIGSVV